jgi:hypothetical protein
MNFHNILSKIDQYDKPVTQLKEVKSNAPLKELDIKSIKKLSGLNESAVAECGMPPMMGGMPSSPPVTMNVSVNASGTENIRDLLDLLKGGDMMGGDDAVSGPVGAVLSVDSEEENPMDMLARDDDERGEEDDDMIKFGNEKEVEEEADGGGFDRASTTPDPQTAPLGAAFPKGNDIHSKGGNEVPKVNGGGNPYTVTAEGLKSQLHNLYQEVRSR